MGDCSEISLSEKDCGLYCSFWKWLVIVPLLFPIGSSKSKQSAQFDPAKQAYTGKVQTCHERRNGNVDDIVYPGGESLGRVADFLRICGMLSNSTLYWGAVSNHKFLCYSLFPFRKSFLRAPQTLPLFLPFIHCSQLYPQHDRHTA